MQLYELELNFIAKNIQRKLKTLKTQKEKLSMILDFIGSVNEVEYNQLYDYLKTLSTDQVRAFIKETEDNGFYIHQAPFWGNVGFDELSALYDKYDWIKPYTCTINGKPIQHKLIMGEEYVLKLMFSFLPIAILDDKLH